jgi:hypothetical protein
MKRAKKEIGVKSYIEFDGNGEKCWFCRLPNPEGEQSKLPNFAEMQKRANETLRRMRQNMNPPKTTT